MTGRLMRSAWGTEHPTLGLGEIAFAMADAGCFGRPLWSWRGVAHLTWRLMELSFEVDSCFPLAAKEFGSVGRILEEPLLLEWKGSTHFSLTMNLLRFLQVMSDALPWLQESSIGRPNKKNSYSKLNCLQLIL